MAHIRLPLLLAFVAGAFAGPLSYWEQTSTTCATRCPENTKFVYEPGKTYDYQYESDLKTHVSGASEEHSSLHMRATVQMEVLSRCEMVLKLSDVSLQDSNPEQYDSRQYVERAWEFTRSLQEKPLRFAFLDGQIENICPEPEETWVLNIKRGILSALQNTMPTLESNVNTRETDVSGDCPVEYEVVSSGWRSTKVKKTKDLLGCTERHGDITAFQGSPYMVNSNVQSLPLMKSSHECEQEINSNGLLVMSSCTEEHVFRPFSSGSSGAMTEVFYKIRFNKESPGIRSRQDTISERSTLAFDHTLTPEELEQNLHEAQKTLTDICRETRNDIRPEVPHLFASLVRQMKMLDSRSLSTLTSDNSCPNAQRFVMDAVPLLGTSASISLMRDMIKRNRVPEPLVEMWVTHMAFYSKIDADMLNEAKPLLEMNPPQSKVMLAVSSMVYTYCRSNPSCETDRVVMDISRILEQNLRSNCRARNLEEHDQVLMSLKSLGNMGNAPQVLPTLLRCSQNDDIPTELQVVAMQAFRRMGCSSERRELLNIFTNQAADSELRINAYLAVMQCADPDILRTVHTTLASEQINQVGSFVWTHLTNLMETSSPHKQEIRMILEDIELAKTFDMDKRKFSRNIEWSGFSETLNTGAIAEANLIWSTDSYVPRSASFNFTIDLFGQSYNLLEIGGRLEGFENILEKLFGEEREINDIVNRERRDAIDTRYLNRLDQSFRREPSDPHATYSIKMFGNELRYGDFHGLNLEQIKDRLNYLDWLIELAKEHSFDQTFSTMFLDTSCITPTAVGMPLKLDVDGTATVNLKVNGKMDIRQLFSSPASMDITGTIAPSGAVEINSEMIVSAFVAKAGMRMTATLHSSTAADGSIKLQDGKIFNAEFKMPQDKMEVISAESKFFVLYRDEEREQVMVTENRVEKEQCYRGLLTKALGLEACGELSFSRGKSSTPWFPFTGPARASLVLNKRDTFTKYEFEAKYIKTKNVVDGQKEIIDTARVSFNTPGSRIDRELTTEFNLNRLRKTVSLELRTPWKQASVNGAIVDTDTQKKVELSATIDRQTEYSAVAEVLIEEKLATFYTPSVRISIPGRRPITLTGSVQYKPAKRLDMNLSLQNLFRNPVVLEGNYMINSKLARTDGSLTLTSGMLDAKVEGRLDENDDGVATSMTVEYTYNHGPQQRVSFNSKMRDQSTENSIKYGINGGWESSFFPNYNGDVAAEFSFDDQAMTVSFDGGFDDVRRIRTSKTSSYVYKGPTRQLDTNFKFEFPYKGWVHEYDLSHKHTRDSIKTTVNVKAPVKGLFDLDVKRESQSPLKLSADAKLQYPGRKMSWSQNIEETEPKVYNHNLNVQLAKYQTMTVTSVYRMEPRHEVSAQINLPELQPITVSGYLKPELSDMQAGGEVTYNRQTYLVNTNWEASGNMRIFNTKGAFELKYPERHIKTEGELNRKYMRFTSNMETLWDASRDPSQKVTMNGDVKLKMETPAIILNVQWPGQNFINIDASGGYETEGWYASKKDVHGKATFKSGFRGYEIIEASFKHDWSKKGIESSAEATWPRGKLSGDLNVQKVNGWSNVQTSVDVNTPFRGFRVIKVTSNYNLQDTKLETSNSFQWDQQQVQLNGELDLRRHLLDGRISFTSPFQGFEELSLTGRHTDNGRQFNSNMEATWAPGRSITATFQMQHQMTGWSVTNNGDLRITTPFPENRQMGLTWQHENDDNSFNCHYELEFMNRKNIYDMELKHEKSRGVRTFTGSAVINSPYTGTRSMQMSHSHELRSWRNIKASFNGNWDPRTRVSYSHEVSVNPWESMTGQAKFTSPFRGYRSIELDLETTKSGATYSTKNELKWDGNNKISLTGSASINGFMVQSNLRFTSPFTPVERIMMNINNRPGAIWVSHADLEYSPNQKIELDTQFGMERQKKLSVELKTPFRYMRSFSLDNTLRGTPRDFRLDSELDYDLIGGKTTLSIVFDTASLDDIKVKGTFRSPRPEVSLVKVVGSHKRQGDRFISDASLEYPNYRGTASNDMTYHSWRDFTTTSSVEYLPGRRVEVSSEMKMDPKIAAAVTFRSPFRNFEQIGLSVNHEGDYMNFRSGGELSYSPSHKITLNGDFSLRTPSVSGSARFTSPFSNAERINLAFSHEGDSLKSLKNSGSFELNNMRFGAENEFSLRRGTLMATSKVTTPYRGYENIDVTVNHRGELTNFNNEASVTYGRQIISGTTEFSLVGGDLNGKLTLNSPFRQLRSLEATFNHDHKKWTNFENRARVVYNNQPYTAESRLKWFGSSLTVEGKATIPEEYGLLLKHKGDLDNFNTKAQVAVAGQQSSFNADYKKDSRSYEGSVNVVTPYRGYETFDGSFSHRGDLRSFNSEAEINTPFPGHRKFSGTASFKNMDTIEGSINVATPYDNWRRTGAGFTHSGSSRRFETSANVQTSFPGYERFTGTLNHNGGLSNMDTSAVVTTSIPGFERFNLNLNHDGDNLRRVKSSVTLQTPIQGMENFGIDIDHSGNMRRFQTKANVNSPFRGYERFGIDVDHTGDLSNFRSTGTFTTPFRELRQATVSVNHRGDLRDFSSGGSLEYNGKKYEGEASFKQTHPDWTMSDYEGSMKLGSPFDVLRNLEISISHSRSAALKTGKVEVSYNGEKKADVDYEYTITGRRNVKVTMREPRPMEGTISYDLEGSQMSADADLNWNTRQRGNSVRLDGSLKNVMSRQTTDRGISFKVTTPSRTVGVKSSYRNDPNSFSSSSELQWDRSERSKIGYDFEFSKNERRSLKLYDGKFTLVSALLPIEATFVHRCTPSRQHTTEVSLQPLTLKNELTFNNPGFTHTLTIQHPRFSRDAVISTEGTIASNLVDGKISIAYERESFSFEGRVADESSYNNLKWSASTSLKHPNSNLDFQWTGELMNNPQLASGSMEAKYKMTRSRQQQIMSLRTEIKKLQEELDAQLTTPMIAVTMTGRKTAEGQYTGEIQSGRDTISGDVSIDWEAREVRTQIRTTPYDSIDISGAYNGPNSMSLDIVRKENGAPVKDLSVGMNLLSDNLVSGKASIRPGLWTDMKNWYDRQDFMTPIQRQWNEVYPTLNEELRYKKIYLQRAAEPLSEAASSVMEDVNTKGAQIERIFSDMYANNDFYMQDMYKTMKRTYRSLEDKIQRAKRDLYRNTAELRAKMDDWKYCVDETLAVMQQKWEELKLAASNKWAEYEPYTTDIKGKFMDWVDRVRTHPKVQMWIERLTTMSPEEYFQSLRNWEPTYQRWYAKAQEWWNTIKNNQALAPVRDMAIDMYNQAKTIYDEHLKEYAEGVYRGGMQYIKSELYSRANRKLHLDEDRWTVWDPQRGEYAFRFYVPMWPMDMWRNLPSLPDIEIDVASYLVKAKQTVMSWLPDADWSLADMYYQYKPSSDIANWIPPFKGRATIAGSQHFMTFDKRFYEYTGECSYMLARDFINGHFSVIVNYERIRDVPTKKSITVISGDHQFEIFPNAKVLMDGQTPLEMPVQMDDTTILRTYHEIRVQNKHGITVACNLDHDRCTLEVTGWYYGKTGGLFGTYNNEPVDDFMTPGRVIAANEADFADSWTVGTRCRAVNHATDIQTSPDNHRYKLCAKYFMADDSPFRRCFRLVDPERFMHMCLNDMPDNINSIPSEEDLCKIASFYVHECRAEGVPLEEPKVCVRCDLHDDRQFYQGQNITLNKGEGPQAADVVFVIQHHPCTQEPTQQLKEIADKLYKAYKSNSIKDVQFSVVGFGGMGIEQEPHVHTMEGRLFNSRDKLNRVIDNFDQEPGPHDDVMAAVHYASLLPFRAGVAKSIVLITCDLESCQKKSVDYSQLHDVLYERDIRLHYLLEHEFVAKSGKKPVSIYGVDDEFAYTKKDAKKVKGSSKLRGHVAMPKNLCSALAEETDGSIFDIQQWRDVKPTVGDKFEDAFANLVAKKGKLSKCQICECVPDETGVGMSICRSCDYNDDDDWFGGDVFVISDDEVVTSKPFKKPKTLKKLKAKRKRPLGN